MGVGGSGANDGGAGMLAALGVGTAQALAGGGARLADLADDGLHGLAAARERFRGVELVVAADVDLTLLGFHGASASAAADKGATPEGAQQLEGALGRLRPRSRQRSLPPARDLLTGAARRLDREPGAGAAGGLGYGLLLLGGHVRQRGRRGAAGRRFRRPARCRRPAWSPARRSSTGRRLRGTVVAGVAQAALAVAVPTVVLAGQALVGRRETMTLGLAGTYAVAERPDRVAACSRPTRRAPWRRARPGWRAPGPRAATARRTLDGAGNTSRRPWVGTVDRTTVASRGQLMTIDSKDSPMTEQVDTQAATAATEAPAHGVVADRRGRRQGQEPARAGGSRRPAPARRRAARRLLRSDLPALLRRAHPRR